MKLIKQCLFSAIATAKLHFFKWPSRWSSEVTFLFPTQSCILLGLLYCLVLKTVASSASHLPFLLPSQGHSGPSPCTSMSHKTNRTMPAFEISMDLRQLFIITKPGNHGHCSTFTTCSVFICTSVRTFYMYSNEHVTPKNPPLAMRRQWSRWASFWGLLSVMVKWVITRSVFPPLVQELYLALGESSSLPWF